MTRVTPYISVTEHLAATLFLDVVTYLFSLLRKNLAAIKFSHFAQDPVICTTQAPMAITFPLFIDRLHKRLPGDDSAALSAAALVGGVTVVMLISVI
jgi:hypothetical protein